ncbi:unnamed protein product [Paramecium octaurelia]|uniref:Uncharacterized protein n=1 Tax=Paramecium octaurelia TaxID=43137 RepID=A0A8S1VP71_PAROT|nr:unnamed protein product [Paramecium octaurelia]
MGFCLNQECQNATQYCYKCLNTTHSEHFNNCIRFTEINQILNESMQVYNQLMKQFKEISKQLDNLFEQTFKKNGSGNQSIRKYGPISIKQRLFNIQVINSYTQELLLQGKRKLQIKTNNIVEEHSQYTKEYCIRLNSLNVHKVL